MPRFLLLPVAGALALALAMPSSGSAGDDPTFDLNRERILPPNLYRNMNATSILKNRAARHVVWTKRYTHGAGAWWQDDFAAQVCDGEVVVESSYFCVA